MGASLKENSIYVLVVFRTTLDPLKSTNGGNGRGSLSQGKQYICAGRDQDDA